MQLILWRHCEAESGAPDLSRRLTPRGRKEAERMASWLSRRLPDDCRILVSPAVRAQQTAHALQRRFDTVPELAPGALVADVLRIANWPDAGEPVLVVGHQPTLGRDASSLLEITEADRPMGSGSIVWLATRGDRAFGATLNVAIGPEAV
jgi:phosphohistidine phosphatase